MRVRQDARRSARGVALILVMMVAAVFLILMGTLIDVLAIESQNSIESADAEAALTAAYSGVDLLILQTEEYYQNSIQNGQPPQMADCSFNEPGGGTVHTQCHSILLRTWNGSGLNYYLIESTGTALPLDDTQTVTRTVQALVKEIPFGAYAMFSETDTPNTGGAVWYSSGQSYTGPVYSGGPMHIRYDSNSTSPIFPDGFTSSMPESSIKWYNIETGENKPPKTPNEMYSVYGASGQPSFPSSTQSLPGFAQNLVVFSEAYFGDSTHDDPKYLPTSDRGVFVNQGNQGCGGAICTGIFVQGDADLKASSVASPQGDLSSGTQTWEFDPPTGIDPNGIPNKVTITVDFGQGTTTVVDSGGGTKVYSGLASGEAGNGSNGNGAIFVNGSLNVNDGGTVHGQYTLAVPDPPQNSESMTLGGSLQYSSDPLKGPSQDELALWADKIWLNSSNNNPIIDGMILTGYFNECIDSRKCGGYFANQNCNGSSCTGGTGSLSLYGSIIENMRGKMGVVGPDGNLLGGYLKNASYDPRLGANPPPFSPTTNLYSIIALNDHGRNADSSLGP
jgi:hypothetical protein